VIAVNYIDVKSNEYGVIEITRGRNYVSENSVVSVDTVVNADLSHWKFDSLCARLDLKAAKLHQLPPRRRNAIRKRIGRKLLKWVRSVPANRRVLRGRNIYNGVTYTVDMRTMTAAQIRNRIQTLLAHPSFWRWRWKIPLRV